MRMERKTKAMKACCQKPSYRLIVVYLRESWNSGAHTSPMAQSRTLTDSPNFLSFAVQHLAPRISLQVVFPNFPLLHVVELRGNPGMSLHWQHSSAAAVIWQKINRQIIITILIRVIVIIMMMMMMMMMMIMMLMEIVRVKQDTLNRAFLLQIQDT